VLVDFLFAELKTGMEGMRFQVLSFNQKTEETKGKVFP
jgi:hypothetical protein